MKAFALTLVFTLIHLSTCGIIQPSSNAITIPGSFIVTLRDDYSVPNFLNTAVLSGSPVRNAVTNTFEFINSFSVNLSNEQLGLLNAFSEGVEITHSEFGGRAIFGTSFITTEENTDKNGHGTHVAGTIAGKTYGVAKNVTLVAVKVLNGGGSGSTSNIISGIQWAINDHNQKQLPSVINLSLGGSFSQVINNAVKAAVAADITVVVAAGNNGLPVKLYSPASEPSAITVAASDINDAFASFSNFGPEVDIIAPGVNITSTWINGGINTISGTSMASPHVAGLAANFIYDYGLTTPADVKSKILQYATENKITTTLPNVGLPLPNLRLPNFPLPKPLRVRQVTVNKLAYNNVIP